MISIIVQQPAGDYQGPDITDPLITSRPQALAKGRSQIYKHHRDKLRISGTMSMQPYMVPGSVVLYTDRQGNQHRAVLRRAAITVNREGEGDTFNATTAIVLEFIKP